MTIVQVLGSLVLAQPVPPTTATFYSDPVPALRYSDGQIVLHKELVSFGNYGLDGASDIVYTGQAATWHFPLPSGLMPGQAQNVFLRTSLVADDHATGIAPYTLAVWTNGAYLGNGPAGLPHGSPFSTVFTNWVQRDYPVTSLAQPYSLTLQNTSNTATGDWVAADYIELNLIFQGATILPNHASDGGMVVATIVGPGLTGATSVTLTGVGADIPGQNLTALQGGALSVAFNLEGAAPGSRSLVIQSGTGTKIIPGAFMVQQGASPAAWLTNFQVVSQAVASGGQQSITYRADLVNTGPALGPLSVKLSSSDPFALRVLPGQDTLTFDSIPGHAEVTSNGTFKVLIPNGATLDAAKLLTTFQTPSGAPIANPGPNQTVKAGSTVTLDGSGSLSPVGAGQLSYEWTFTSRPPGTNARLFYTSSIIPTFTADVPGVYVIRLAVTNESGSSSANVAITAVE